MDMLTDRTCICSIMHEDIREETNYADCPVGFVYENLRDVLALYSNSKVYDSPSFIICLCLVKELKFKFVINKIDALIELMTSLMHCLRQKKLDNYAASYLFIRLL